MTNIDTRKILIRVNYLTFHLGGFLLSQKVVSFSTSTIEKMRIYYEKFKVASPPGAVFRAKTNDANVTAYHSGKVLFQGKNPLAELKKWSSPEQTNDKQLLFSMQPSEFIPSDSIFSNNHIGSDESGTGDYFGPVTTCAVFVHKDQIETLKSIGIQDSKQIQDKQIYELTKQLMQMNIPYSSMVLDNLKYNKLQKQGWTQGKMKTMLHYHVIKQLMKKIKDFSYEGIVIDQFCEPNTFINHLSAENLTLPEKTFFMTKAENYSIAVATASVIARIRFLQEMERLSNEIGVTLLKGASQAVDKQIAGLIRSEGEDVLKNIAKVHFANTKKARNYL